MNDIPDWAGRRACELLNADSILSSWCWPQDDGNGALVTVAKLVMQYEQPPIDPDEEAVKRILRAWHYGDEVADFKKLDDQNFARAVSQYKQEKANG